MYALDKHCEQHTQKSSYMDFTAPFIIVLLSHTIAASKSLGGNIYYN